MLERGKTVMEVCELMQYQAKEISHACLRKIKLLDSMHDKTTETQSVSADTPLVRRYLIERPIAERDYDLSTGISSGSIGDIKPET
ncbi:MAG: hypothetical protein JKY01_07875 [Pseudomonadales bacterium]|nr:hypothetical protein [Pseudomonadales bacterium]